VRCVSNEFVLCGSNVKTASILQNTKKTTSNLIRIGVWLCDRESTLLFQTLQISSKYNSKTFLMFHSLFLDFSGNKSNKNTWKHKLRIILPVFASCGFEGFGILKEKTQN